MQPGSLLICVDNKQDNPNWKGTLPDIDQYYTCREIFLFIENTYLYVEEIVSSLEPKSGIEYYQDPAWYKEVQPPMNIEEILKIAEEILI